MNIEGFIKDIEREIELLTEDLGNTKSDISKRVLHVAITNRKERIEEVKEKYLT